MKRLLNLMEDEIGAVILGGEIRLKAGAGVSSGVRRSVGEELAQGVVGRSVDLLTTVPFTQGHGMSFVLASAIGVMGRKSVHEPLMTGIMSVNTMFPIGRGQRELVSVTVKLVNLAIAIDTMINRQRLVW